MSGIVNRRSEVERKAKALQDDLNGIYPAYGNVGLPIWRVEVDRERAWVTVSCNVNWTWEMFLDTDAVQIAEWTAQAMKIGSDQ